MSTKLFFNTVTTLLIFILTVSKLYAGVSGNSAWLYGKNNSWVDEIFQFNEKMNDHCRVNYLFPETAVVHVDQANNKLIYNYDSSVTQFYKSRLPNVKILPDFSFWVAHTNFMEWNVRDYQLAAKAITKQINQDANADGVFLDLENYKKTLLPFYKTLALELKKNNKIISVIVRPGQENITWFKSLGDNAFVVLYGYDLHQATDGIYPVFPLVYKQRLEHAFSHLIQVANKSNTPVMGGIPVIATSYEWEQKIISPSHVVTNHYQQVDYLKAALAVYDNQPRSKLYMGYSIWAFVDGKNKSALHEFPYEISDTGWQMLQQC